LSSEALERRELLAGDFAAAHNYFLANDVDNNMRVTPMDALTVINHLNRNGGNSSQVGQGEEIKAFVDVNGDNRVTAADALSVINTLNRMGEGAGEPLLEVQLSARDGNSVELARDSNGAYNVAVGQVFELEVGYLDLREDKIFTLPTGTPGQTVDVRFRQGVFQLVADIGVSGAANAPSLITPIIAETQQITVGKQIDDPTKTLALEVSLTSATGQVSTGKARIAASDFSADPTGTLTTALQSLEDANGPFLDAGTTVQVTRLPSTDPDDFFLQVRFGGNDAVGVNQPTILIQPVISIAGVGEFPFNDAAVTNKEFRTDNVLQGVDSSNNAVGQRYDIDYESRSLPNPNGGSFDFLNNRPAIGSFDPGAADPAEVFNDIGGLGPVIAGGVPEANGGDEDTLDNVFDALSIPVFINAPVQGLTFEVTPGEDSNGESFLIYGFLEEPDAQGNDNSRPVPLDQVRFDADARFVINATVDGGPVTPTVSVTVDPAAVNEDGTGTLNYTFTRTGDTTNALSVSYAVSGTATSGTDFTALSGTVTIPAGQTSATVSVDPTDDTTVEPDETIVLTVTDTASYDVGASATATGTITNDDVATVTPVVTVAVNPAAVNEDGSGTLIYTFTRTGATTDALVVSYTVGGTATSGTDFTALSGTVTIPAGQSSATVSVNPTDDSVVEPDETIILTITDTATYDVGTAGAATGTITDDDTATVTPVVTVTVNPTAVNEDGSGTLVYTFARTGATTDALAVTYTVSGTATSGSDFTALSGTVTIPAGQSSVTVSVNPIDDSVVEPDETIILTITDTATYDVGAAGAATGTITNDDTAPVTPVVTVAVNPAAVNEDGSGTLVYTFSRTGATTAALTVNYSVSGTATPGSDFTALSGSVTIPAGQSSATINVNPTDDTTVEPDETIILTVIDTASYDVGAAAAATGTITNDDQVVVNPGTISLSPATISVSEGGSVATFTITRTGGSDGAVSVVFATSNGTAIAGADYTGKTQTVSFADGDSATQTITVSIIDDTVDEPNETFNVTLAGATGGAVLGAKASVVTILDNDPTDPGTGSTVAGSIYIDKVENLQEVINSPGSVAPFRDGVKDADESGLAGVRVELRTASGELVATAFTDMNGSYRFTGVSQGSYRLRFGVSAANTFLSGSNEIPVTVGASGSTVAPGNLPVLGLSASMSNLDILASSYLRGNSDAASASNNGRRGGSVALDSSGHQIFFMAAEGFDNVDYSELLLNDAKDAAILTIVDGTDIKTALLDKNDFVISRDGSALQFFGGIEELGFVSTSNPLNSQGFSQAAIDALFSRAAEIANNN
tara:strand:- start:2284 stop:6231 length:3948 start_codon:yes stop_codon:yes gene_type:complete